MPESAISVAMRDYVDARFAALDRRVTELDVARGEAVEVARVSMNARLDTMNEFRGSLNDLANRAATRDQLDAVREKLHDVKIQIAVMAALVSLLMSVIVAAVSRMLT